MLQHGHALLPFRHDTCDYNGCVSCFPPFPQCLLERLKFINKPSYRMLPAEKLNPTIGLNGKQELCHPREFHNTVVIADGCLIMSSVSVLAVPALPHYFSLIECLCPCTSTHPSTTQAHHTALLGHATLCSALPGRGANIKSVFLVCPSPPFSWACGCADVRP